MEQPGFWAVLPANVRYDKQLSPSEKIFYCEVTAMTQAAGYCYASNKYFAELYGVDERTIQRYVKKLKKAGYIRVDNSDGVRKIFGADTPPTLSVAGGDKNVGDGVTKMSPEGRQKCHPEYNKINNTRKTIDAGARAKGEQGWKDVFLTWARKQEEVSCGLEEALMDFGEFRQSGKHPLTVRAAQLSLRALERLAEAVAPELQDAYKTDVLHQSIQRGWEGLFKLDDWTPPSMVHRGSGKDRPRMIGEDVDPEDLF